MNKQEKEEKAANFENALNAYWYDEQIAQIASTIAFEIAHTLYTEINEHIFDRSLAEESDDKTYQAVYKEIYYKVIKELDGDNWWENTTQNDK